MHYNFPTLNITIINKRINNTIINKNFEVPS